MKRGIRTAVAALMVFLFTATLLPAQWGRAEGWGQRGGGRGYESDRQVRTDYEQDRSYGWRRDRGGYDRGYDSRGDGRNYSYDRGYDDRYGRGRSAGKSAAIIAGGAGAGAAIGAIGGGGKGALIGAAIGGVSGLIIDQATKRRRR